MAIASIERQMGRSMFVLFRLHKNDASTSFNVEKWNLELRPALTWNLELRTTRGGEELGQAIVYVDDPARVVHVVDWLPRGPFGQESCLRVSF